MKRSELFNLLWLKPTSTVAKQIGMSDRGLARLCDRHHIPVPPRGYWARIKAGQYPARMPLPRPDDDHEIELRCATLGSDATIYVEESEPMGDGETEGTVSTPVLEDAESAESVEPLQAQLPSAPNGQCSENSLKLVKSTQRTNKKHDISISQSGEAVSKTSPYEIHVALEAEFNKAAAAGIEFQKRQAAELVLGEIQRCLPQASPDLAQALQSWSKLVQSRLSRSNPIDEVIRSIQQASDGGKQPIWWNA